MSTSRTSRQRLTGYQAANDVTITVRDLAKLGTVVDAVVAAGANQINSIAFGLANPRAAEDAARRAAVQALAAKAALYAEATGTRLVRLVNLSEGGGLRPSRRGRCSRMAAQAADVQSGELRCEPRRAVGCGSRTPWGGTGTWPYRKARGTVSPRAKAARLISLRSPSSTTEGGSCGPLRRRAGE